MVDGLWWAYSSCFQTWFGLKSSWCALSTSWSWMLLVRDSVSCSIMWLCIGVVNNRQWEQGYTHILCSGDMSRPSCRSGSESSIICSNCSLQSLLSFSCTLFTFYCILSCFFCFFIYFIYRQQRKRKGGMRIRKQQERRKGMSEGSDS